MVFFVAMVMLLTVKKECMGGNQGLADSREYRRLIHHCFLSILTQGKYDCADGYWECCTVSESAAGCITLISMAMLGRDSGGNIRLVGLSQVGNFIRPQDVIGPDSCWCAHTHHCRRSWAERGQQPMAAFDSIATQSDAGDCAASRSGSGYG
jgi:hypothetical protein